VSLRLQPERLEEGFTTLVIIKLENTGSVSFSGCLSPPWGVQLIQPSGKTAGSLEIVDHRWCEESIILRPGETIEKSVSVTPDERGEAILSGTLSFVMPETCREHYGCDTKALGATRRVKIESREKGGA
jgi:hypothetical protein